jgi:FkbM family methyltransferase
MLRLKILLRSFLRRFGITKILAKYFHPNRYEQKFDNAMFRYINPGDLVWDIGANVGYYTIKFAEAVSASGEVHGFEPMPDTFKILSKETSNHSNIRLSCCALGREDGSLPMTNDVMIGSSTNKILVDDSEGSNKNSVMIKVRSGNSLIEGSELKIPNFIKIDVEGHENDVLNGMTKILMDPRLHTLAIEIHFALLEERGLKNAPSNIVSILKNNNFNVKWSDPSHILATRS